MIRNKKLISKSQLKFRSEKHRVFAEEVNEIALSTTNDKKIQLIYSIEKYAYGTSKELVCKKKKLNATI